MLCQHSASLMLAKYESWREGDALIHRYSDSCISVCMLSLITRISQRGGGTPVQIKLMWNGEMMSRNVQLRVKMKNYSIRFSIMLPRYITGRTYALQKIFLDCVLQEKLRSPMMEPPSWNYWMLFTPQPRPLWTSLAPRMQRLNVCLCQVF